MKCLWMATTPRSGSNFLCQRLFERARLQMPKEFLNMDFLRQRGVVDDESRFLVPSLDALLERAAPGYDRRETALPICIKAMYTHLVQARTLPGVSEWLRAETVILLLRQDIVGQAVSLYIAEHTGRWTSYGRPRSEDRGDPPYDFKGIAARARRIEQHVALWRQTFAAENVDYRVVYYEQLMTQPDELLEELMHVWQLKPRARQAQPANPHERQTTALNEEFIERYRRDGGGGASA